jgi:hypothetical protein
MPVSNTSRYVGLPIYNALDADGQHHPTVPIRLHAEPTLSGNFEHRLTGAETLEFLSWRYFGTSEFWWRIADMNPDQFPLDLEPGTAITIPSSTDFGLVVRERSFGS